METVFPHPTLSEMMHESVLAAYGRAHPHLSGDSRVRRRRSGQAAAASDTPRHASRRASSTGSGRPK